MAGTSTGEESEPQTKTIVLLRHAKADRSGDVEDHDRPLTARGRQDAIAAGALLARRGIRPDVVLCSTSLRTRQTWEAAGTGGAEAGEVRTMAEVYQATASELAEVLRGVEEEAGCVLLVGHAPGVPDLLDHLAVRKSSGGSWEDLDDRFPTSGIAVLSYDGRWSDLRPGRAELVSFDVPRGTDPT